MLLRKLSPLVASLSLLLLLGSPARALDNAACCVSTTSKLDSLMNPVKGSDEKFFAKPSGPPNVVFMIDTSGSMDSWPRDWSTTKGCGFLDDLGYQPSRTYPALWSGVTQQDTDWFNTNLVYKVNGSRGYGTDLSGAPRDLVNGGTIPTWSSVGAACGSIAGGSISSTDRTACEQCLNTRGYYTYNGSNRRATGNFLNFYSPRDSGALKVLAEVVKDLREVRFSIVSFGAKNNEGSKCWGRHPWTGEYCVCLNEPMKPTCDKSYPLDGSSWESSRNSILNSISADNMFGWNTCGTPLDDVLYAAGFHLANKTGTRAFDALLGAGNYPTSSNFNEGGTSNSRSVCFDCSFNAVILLTDGEPVVEGLLVPIPQAIRDRTVACPGCSGSSNLHKVADFLWNSDVRRDADMPSQQKVATYTIGFSDDVADSNLLKATAKAGGGKFYPARSSSQLKNVIISILEDINSRNTSFSSSAITALQVQTSALTAVVPRMMPSRTDPWAGALYRFEQFNEFVQEQNLNGDTDREDVFLRDRDNSVVAEKPDTGDYYKATFNATGGTVLTPTLAKPFWEANAKIIADGANARKIWTVVDSNGDGALTHADNMVEFTEGNAATLLPYLGIGGAPECPDFANLSVSRGAILEKFGLDPTGLFTLFGTTLAAITNQNQMDLLCARLVIRFIRGHDVGDLDGDGNRTELRDSVLGDIFHSSPIIVDPPADKFLCDMGIVSQCSRTLYSSKLGVAHTPLTTDTTHPRDCRGGGNISRDAYDKYQFLHRKRERVILVGANDGMLHAFSDGLGEEPASGPCEVKYLSANSTGREIWAFIPPDQLPRLYERLLEPHRYYVDGDTMVREVWAGDLNNNGAKDFNEYKVMAIGAEGRGGNHYFGLEVQWNEVNGLATTAKRQPGFRWMFPQPCTEEATRFGKTLYSLAPKSPPIGPVLLESSTGVERYGVNTTETWVATLSGGWSPAGERGRGIYMVDVWNGQVAGRKDNLVWKYEFDPSASGGDAPKKEMTYGIVAPVAMVDYGANNKPRLDGFFDTAVVGDLGGQLWTFRFYEPGKRDPTTGLVTNWSGGRSFQMDKEGVSMGNNKDSVAGRQPIHYLASIGLQPENRALRAFVGTGDRYSVLDTNAGTCRFDNPLACSKLGCGDTKIESLLKLPSGTVELENHWKDRKFEHGQFQTANMPASFCGPVNKPDHIVAEFSARSTKSCPSVSNANQTVDYDFALTRVECGQNAGGAFACRVRDAGNLTNMSDLQVNPAVTQPTLGKNRYYGLWVYGGKPERLFKENPASASTDQTASQYDLARLSDTGSTALFNVTSTTCNATNCTGNQAPANGFGWYFEYPEFSHKTGTGSAIIASCVLWNSVFPASSAGSACANPSAAKAQLFQADFITGAPNCAAGFNFARALDRDVVAPPTEPAIITQISKSGALQVAAVVGNGGGGSDKIPVTANPDVLQSIYELPVSRALHDCRHQSDGECAPVSP